MTRFAPALVALLALAACNKASTVAAENASTAEVAQKVAEVHTKEGGFISPGQWRTTMTIKEMAIPGLPPQAQEAMRAQMAKATNVESCVTPEQAKNPDPKMFAGKGNDDCRYDKFTMGDGKIDATMQCKSASGGTVKLVMNGTYSAEAYQMKAAVEQSGPQGTMSMKIENNAQRVGACKA